MKKRISIGLIVGTAVFAAVFGMAAALDVSTDTLGAGTDDVVSCDTDGINVAYTPVWGTGQYEVETITVSGINATACAGHDLSVTVLDSSGAVVGSELTFTLPATGASTTKAFSGLTLPAEDVEDVHAVLTGTPAS